MKEKKKITSVRAGSVFLGITNCGGADTFSTVEIFCTDYFCFYF